MILTAALLAVSRLGPKAFEQSAGFLRITDGDNPLDASAVHPESYALVDAMAGDLGLTIADMMGKKDLRDQIDLSRYVTATVGIPTLNDILTELAKPGRDPRTSFESFSFADGIEKIDDLQKGMRLPGIVTNITAFGAFVDIGVHQDGLVHISQMADRFVKNPADIVTVQQKVTVTVLDVDANRHRISLSMKKAVTPSENGSGKVKARSDQQRSSTPNESRKQRRKPVYQGPLADALRKSGFN